jgi:ABC-type sugar transport system substrate-binding protein
MEPTMRLPMMLLMTGAVALLATLANAADDKLIIAVFTKNLTNPAYEAFRICIRPDRPLLRRKGGALRSKTAG